MPLVLLESLATTTTMWEELLPALAARRPALLLDYPGHGRSPDDDRLRTLDDLALAVLRVADEEGLSRVHVAGVSIGGMLALRLAALAPERIASVTTIGSTPVMDAALWLRRERLVAAHGTAGVVDEVLPRWFTDEYGARRPEVVARYRGMLTGTTGAGYIRLARMLGPADLRPGLADVVCPTLVISGGRDAAATAEQGEMIADGVRDGRQVVLPEAAHMLQAMEPDRIAELVGGHVDRAERSSMAPAG